MRRDEKRQGRSRLIRFHFHCFFSIWHFQLGFLEAFGASSKDLLPKRFMYRKLMPDIFCHQEPQIQIRCQKSAKFFPGGSNFHHLFMSYIFEIYYFLIDPVNCWPFRPSFFGTLVLWFLAFLVIWPQISNSQPQKASTRLNSHQHLSTTFELHQERRLSGHANADTPSAKLVKWQREEQQPLPPCPTTQQNTCFFLQSMLISWPDPIQTGSDPFLPRSPSWNIAWTHWHLAAPFATGF